MQQLDRPRADTLDAQHIEEAAGHLCSEPLVVFEVPRLGQLCELGAQGGAGAGDVRRRTASVALGHVLRPALDGIGDPAVGNGLVDHLAQDLEHVRDLVEDPSELAVADHRFAGAGRAARSRHAPSL